MEYQRRLIECHLPWWSKSWFKILCKVKIKVAHKNKERTTKPTTHL